MRLKTIESFDSMNDPHQRVDPELSTLEFSWLFRSTYIGSSRAHNLALAGLFVPISMLKMVRAEARIWP